MLEEIDNAVMKKMEVDSLVNQDVITQIEVMNRKYGFDQLPLTKEQLNFKASCLLEELSELMTAINVLNDADETVDALVDISVFAIGILFNAGVDVREAFTEVMKANLKKERGVKPTRPNSGGIDLVKPAGWKAPHHYNNLGKFEEILPNGHGE